MFKALQPLLTERSIHILLSPAKDGKVGVYVEPVKLDDKEDNAFITPFRCEGTPEELDAELPGVSGHFGSCLRFLVYQVSPTEIRLVDIRDTMDAEFAEDKNLWRARLIGDCHVCYVVSIGGPAAAKVIRADFYPIKIPDGGPALDILKPFQVAMVESPPPWLLKILGVAAEKRLKNYNAAVDDE